MSNPDLITYVQQTAALLIGQLPLQSLNSAVALVYAYISDVGGWLADNPSDPQGPGQPANHFTEQQSANAITAQQIASVYDISFTVSVVLNVQAIAQLTSGLSLSAAAASMASQVSQFIETTINDSNIPLSVNSVGSQATVSGFSLTGGSTTQTVRQDIASNIANEVTDKVVDYKTNALIYVRNTFGVNNTWNVSSVYTEAGDPISVTIQKYTDDTYATLDMASSTVYVMNISPTTYQVISGVVLT